MRVVEHSAAALEGIKAELDTATSASRDGLAAGHTGMTSGGRLVEVDGRKRCLAAIGQQNASWYYPVAKALEWYGPRFNVQVR